MRGHVLTRVLGRCFAVAVAAFLVIPAFIVVPLALSDSMFLEFPPPGYSLQWFRDFFADPEWVGALVRSLIVAASSAVISVPVGLVVAYALVRGRRCAVRALEPVMLAPMMVPVVIFGFGCYLISLATGTVGQLWGLVLAHAALELPFVVVTISAALRTVDQRLELAARVLGANPVEMFIRVVVPLIAPAIGAATLLAAMLSLDETVVALFLVGDTLPTLPVAMFASITYELNPLVPVGATVLVGVSLLLVTGAAVLARLGSRRSAAATEGR